MNLLPRMLVLVALLAGGAQAAPVVTTLTPTADTSIDSRTAANEGTAPVIGVDIDTGWERNAYLRFTVGEVGVVRKAVLRLFFVNGSPGGGVLHLSRSNNAWTEASNARPAESPFPIATFDAVAPNAWLELDVTPNVVAGGTLDVRLSTNTPDGLGISSRESPTNQPQLIITSLPSPGALSAGGGAIVAAHADTFVSQDALYGSFGTAPYVYADLDTSLTQNLGFVRFPLAAERGSQKVVRATVRLYVSNGSTGRVNILPFAEVSPRLWSETATTWAALPSDGLPTPLQPLELQGIPPNHWLELDVTAAARVSEYLTLQIATETADGFVFNSREADTNLPQLVMELQPVPCTAPAVCGAGSTCAGGQCARTCLADATCPPGTGCIQGLCTPRLTTSPAAGAAKTSLAAPLDP